MRARSIGVGVRNIAVVALDDCYPGSVTGIVDALHMLNRHVRNRVMRTYSGASQRQGTIGCTLVGLNHAPVTSIGKFRFDVDEAFGDSATQYDAVILPAFRIGAAVSWSKRLGACSALFDWLRAQRAGGAVFAAHWTGICLLAEAGLLDERVATIPLSIEAAFRRRYPRVRLDLTQSIVIDRDTICAAALADNLRMVWRLLDHFRPGVMSEQTALDLFFHDPDADLLGAPAGARVSELGNPLVDRAKYWLARNHAGKLDLESLAADMAVSERTLFRRFKGATGLTPNAYLQHLRVETAKGILQRTEISIDKVAARVGYANAAYFCRIFRKLAGTTPRAYRLQSRR